MPPTTQRSVTFWGFGTEILLDDLGPDRQGVHGGHHFHSISIDRSTLQGELIGKDMACKHFTLSPGGEAKNSPPIMSFRISSRERFRGGGRHFPRMGGFQTKEILAAYRPEKVQFMVGPIHLMDWIRQRLIRPLSGLGALSCTDG